MSKNIIDAETAKLAGLQIDTLQKVRSGQITLDQLERFNNLSTDDREARFGDWKKLRPQALSETTEKFALLVDIGIITVPDDYVHEKRLTMFYKQNRRKLYYNDEITDKNFPNPTRILKPGDKLRVRAFKQVALGTTTSEECMAFLATQKAIHTSAQGLSLVFEQKREQLPKGMMYNSFDESERLGRAASGIHWVPALVCYTDGDFQFNLGYFERVWHNDHAFLCFYAGE